MFMRAVRALALGLGCCAAIGGGAASGQVVISQIWGGSGGVDNAPRQRLVELFNQGSSPVSLSGFSLQVKDTVSSNSSVWLARNLSGTIPARGYFLVELSELWGSGINYNPDLTFAGSTGATARLPDRVIGPARGIVALVQGTAALTAGSCPPGLNGNAAIVDLVGYGRGETNIPAGCNGTDTEATGCVPCREGSSWTDNAPGGTTNGGVFWPRRRCRGFTDTNNNFADFELVGPGPTTTQYGPSADTQAVFRNSSSPAATSPVTVAAASVPGPLNPNTLAGVARGQQVTFTVTASADCGAVTGVTANLSPLGGGASVNMADQGGGVFTTTATVGASAAFGVQTVVFTARGAGTAQGTLRVVVVQPNDECAGAAVLGSGPGTFPWSNAGATATFDDPANPNDTLATGCGTNPTYADAWYLWTATSTGTFTASTELTTPANFDAKIAVWPAGTCPPAGSTETGACCTGGGCAVLTEADCQSGGGTFGGPGTLCTSASDCTPVPAALGCGDNNNTFAGNPLAAVATFNAVAGRQYLLQIGAAGEGLRTSGGQLRIAAGAPGGACCTTGNTCVVVSDAAACANLGGRRFTANTPCTSQFAPDCSVLGSCCNTGGGCFDGRTQTECEVIFGYIPGSWSPGGTCATVPCPPGGRCCTADGTGCTNVVQAQCPAGSFWTEGLTCAVNPCPSPRVCCRGATCQLVPPLSCVVPQGVLAGALLMGDLTACNPAGNSDAPCCKADYNKQSGVDLLDIFAFLTDWFNGVQWTNHNGDANASGDLLDIFSFLTDWFEGPCP